MGISYSDGLTYSGDVKAGGKLSASQIHIWVASKIQ